MKLKLARVLSTAGLMMAATFASAEVVVIVNASSPINSATAEEIQQVFLGKRNEIGGVSVTPVDHSEGNEVREVFYDKVVDKTPSQLNAYWSRLIFTGKGKPPKQYFDDAEVLETVLEEEDAVGYIDSSSIAEGVKVIFTVQ
ncbi:MULTISPECIES: phosphate ABC transporter substrate-binding protein [unclassified Ketobacter]|uniref:phosphate ABC transporter substrate-binding protein n=1 Tax=unclassified Ketobacter TaxID=2639109 RepID=UPI000F25F61F|nr:MULTISPECIES: phosphate ABC transporter substrate-binding protein [unclassified Ketobacter]RLT88694.1 MAG: phosphate ABC transporter substrate-binding protein [Ketobacter sp. GenoA1]RLT97705.1 MAG: phosphate ABC transporter substrate-binding protein [Ketobacter sp.]